MSAELSTNLTDLLASHPDADLSPLAGCIVRVKYNGNTFAHVKLITDRRCKFGVNAESDGSRFSVLSKSAFHKGLLGSYGYSLHVSSTDSELVESIFTKKCVKL